MKRILPAVCLLLLATLACGQSDPPTPPPGRLDSIPAGAVKMTPESDAWPPVAAAGWSQPVPLDGPVNTAGAEDSPFITLDGSAFFFFFTPNLNIPPEGQVGDGVTGIWVTHLGETGWDEPQRLWLVASGELALDGCPFALDDQLYFCSIREGNRRTIDIYVSEQDAQAWSVGENAGERFNAEMQVGEMYISADGQTLVFASSRPGGLGGLDLWTAQRTLDGWSDPLNLGAPVNTSGDENRPSLSADGQELWFDSISRLGYPGPAIYRSVRQPDDSWGLPEEIISQYAGEPGLSADGEILYFVHHFFSADSGSMIEADIYVSHRLP